MNKQKDQRTKISKKQTKQQIVLSHNLEDIAR